VMRPGVVQGNFHVSSCQYESSDTFAEVRSAALQE
jgi:hypothetical protein